MTRMTLAKALNAGLRKAMDRWRGRITRRKNQDD